jgi:hypothetical protein
MKSIMRTIERVVTSDKRKRTVTLRPKGTKPDYDGSKDVVVNGHTVSGLQMASKVFIIICDVELGKPNMLPGNPGIDPVRAIDGIVGKGFGKKRMAVCNELHRGSEFALTRKGADLPMVSCCMKGSKPVNVSTQLRLTARDLQTLEGVLMGCKPGLQKRRLNDRRCPILKGLQEA